MTEGLPLSHSINLARLGNAGDTVSFAADEAQRAAIAKWSGVLSLERLEVTVAIAKLGATGYGLDFTLAANVTQACVVTLEPVSSPMEKDFSRELVFVGTTHRRQAPESAPGAELVLDGEQEEGPEEIDSLHIDLAAPILEEFILSLDPYPRRPGVEFAPQSPASDPRESPFAALKDLKQGS